MMAEMTKIEWCHATFNHVRGCTKVSPGCDPLLARIANMIDTYEAKEMAAWFREHVWLGVSVENQEQADKRIPLLLQTPATVRFLSCEPLLGDIDIQPWLFSEYDRYCIDDRFGVPANANRSKIDWVIVGGESGHGARPMQPQWARSLRNQCQDAGTPFFFKQWGDFKPCSYCATSGRNPTISHCIMCHDLNGRRVGKKAAGRLLDGREWNEVPS